MLLKGWVNPLPDWIVKALESGQLQVKQAKDHEYLVGTATNPQGTIISFNFPEAR